MKKLFKITGVVFIFLFFCSFALSFVHAEGTTFWSYQEKLLGKLVHPGFTSLAACNNDRDLFIVANPVLGADPCISYTSLLPVPPPIEQPPVIIDPQKETAGGTWYFLEKDTQHQKHTYATASECQKGRTAFVNGDESKADQCISEYKLLAPLGEIKFAPDNVGDYFNMIFKIAIGLCAALAVVMIVIGGVQYMGNESIFGKTEAKSKITSAILGLLIALGSYALLNTINPDLLGKSGVNIQSVSADIIDLPDAGDGDIDPGFAKKDYKYTTEASVSPAVTNVVSKIKDGWTISSFKVYPNERMLISLIKNGVYDNTNVIDVRSGVNGFAETDKGIAGDKKTPKGTWKILSMTTPGNGVPVYNKQGSNMGASFWLLSPTNSGERGIGMHGNKNGTLSRTYGCVRLKNSDILALLPYVKVGTYVTINN